MLGETGVHPRDTDVSAPPWYDGCNTGRQSTDGIEDSHRRTHKLSRDQI